MKVSRLFESLAGTTWRFIKSSHDNRVRLGEDTITTFALNSIAYNSPSSVIYEDTRIDESIKGCDFELWVGNNKCGWYRYAIQAKKINYSTGRYDSLTHKVGTKRQIDVLTHYALSNNATPLYCFYNNSNSSVKWNCKYSKDIEQLGISLSSVNSVNQAINKRGCKNYTYIHNKPKTVPWRCLVKCPKLISCDLKNNRSEHLFGATIINNLPSSLENLREKLSNSYSHDQVATNGFELDLGGLFDIDCNLRPKRIVIIDTGMTG